MPAPLPTAPPFGIFYVSSGAEMSVITTYSDLDLRESEGGHWDTDVGTGDFLLTSGVGTPGTTVRAIFSVPVPDIFTFEAEVMFTSLPPTFTDVTAQHIYLGVTDHQSSTFGLFFSKLGIAFTGSVNYSPTDLLQLNSPVQLLPDSLGLIEEGKYYTLRVVVDSDTGTLYVYVTERASVTHGQLLRYILPALKNEDGVIPQVDSVYLSLRGTSSSTSSMRLAAIGLSNELLIANLPPVALPNNDQTARMCSVVRFDGRASFDPEGAPLSYKWRLVDGPDVSSSVAVAHDGVTYGAGLTDEIYSDTLGEIHADNPFAVEDVLLFNGVAYDIAGYDESGGFHVILTTSSLPASVAAQNCRIVRQSGISGRTTSQPTFFPDVQGIYRFDLTVFDGDLYSLPADTVVNVVDSPVPRGITPDVSFLWEYLPDFWRLVDDKGIVESFWEALAQIAASELLTLWQHDYAKSLSDIQRTFQRKWLHYDFFIREPYPDQTTVTTLYGGLQLRSEVAPRTSPSGGFTATVRSPLFPDQSIRVLNQGVIDNALLVTQIRRQLEAIDKRFTVKAHLSADALTDIIDINAPFPFQLLVTTVPEGYEFELSNTEPKGSSGNVVGVNTYRTDDCKLDIAGVVPGDYLIVDGVAYYIEHIISDSSDQWTGQRIVSRDPLPLVMGKEWRISRGTRSTFLDFHRALCSAGDLATYEIVDLLTREIGFVTTTVLSSAAGTYSALLVDTAPLAGYLSQPGRYSVQFFSVYRRTYLPIDPLVVRLPHLQERIKNSEEEQILRENVDYFIDTFRGQPCLRFATSTNADEDVWRGLAPPERMWAEVTYLNNNPTIEQNFGIQAAFTLDDFSHFTSNADYLSIVRGLWYSYFNGPTLFNLRAGTQILLGLPFAEEAGTILEIRDDYSSTQGRLLVRDVANGDIVRSYYFPASLDVATNPNTGVPYAVGDTVQRFAPLVTGVEVADYVKNPEWFARFRQQVGFCEIEKFFKFMVRIDSAAFSLDTLMFVRSFILRINPTYTFPVFVILKKLKTTTVDVDDDLAIHVKLNLNDWTGVFNYDNQTSGYVDGAGNSVVPPDNYGHLGGAFDDARPAFGGMRGQFDGDHYNGTPTPGVEPVSPTAEIPTHWGFDSNYLSPECAISAAVGTEFLAPTPPSFDSIFSFDGAYFTQIYSTHTATLTRFPHVPTHSVSTFLGQKMASAGTGNVTTGVFFLRAAYPLPHNVDVYVEVRVAGIQVATATVSLLESWRDYVTPFDISFPVVSGDMVEVLLSASVETPLEGGAHVEVSLGDGSSWSFDQGDLPAGRYEVPWLL